jgi:uncharacterized protein YfaP (DUF2135 family)
MNNRLILLCIMFVLSLLALPLTGCDPDSGRTLALYVDTPKDGTTKDGITVTTSTIAVGGRVAGSESKGAKVSVNGADVPVKDLKFSTDVTLTEGKNVINIRATNGQADLNQPVTVIYVPAKK